MKKFIQLTILLYVCVLILPACQKDENFHGHDKWSADNNSASNHAKKYSSEVPLKWVQMQLRLIRVPGGVGISAARCQAYCGVALYESVVPGMPSYRSLDGQLNALPSLPKTDSKLSYHWPTCANAALAYMNRNMLAATTDANKTSMDSLENALNADFQTQVDAATFQRSVDFGKAIAQVIFEWSKTDGTFATYPPYTPPGALPGAPIGLWVPTPPNSPSPANPYGGSIRLLVTGSDAGAEPSAPPPYSEDHNSDMYKMAQEVYDISLTLTPDQTALALYYRDAPGYPGTGHYVSIFAQVLVQSNAALDDAALAYVKMGLAVQDAITACFKTKYTLNRERPIQYIRRVLLKPDWLGLFNTPGHPEFPSAHSNQGGAVEEALGDVFGKKFQFTDHTYDYLGMPAQSFESFSDMAIKIGLSRVYAGIHYRSSCEKGRIQGRKVAQNILNKIKFK